MKTWPWLSTATALGASDASIAGPPSPLYPCAPLPATVEMTPVAASTRRTR